MAERRQQGLNLVLVSALYERVHYALVMASAAAATGRTVRLFVTMGALAALVRGSGNRPGWHGLAAAPGQPEPANQDRGLAQRGVATFEELLQAAVALGAEFMVCEMGLRAMGLTRADLRPDIPVLEGGVVTFLARAEGKGPILFV